ncbi:paired amphipathic helix [Lactarius quietus]|nr:paired amphipathic helix [Lactarius quietus]
MNPSIEPSLQNVTQPPSSADATVPELVQPIPPSPHPPIDNQKALATIPSAPASQPLLPIEKQTKPDAPQPVLENQNGATARRVNVTDALSYLDTVKIQFHDRPDVYNIFLDIMKDFRSQVMDTTEVIRRVAPLFHGNPYLIEGFNTFLPPGYFIEVSSDSQSSEVITVTTPSGTTTLRSTNSPRTTVPPPPPLQPELCQFSTSDQPQAAVSRKVLD